MLETLAILKAIANHVLSTKEIVFGLHAMILEASYIALWRPDLNKQKDFERLLFWQPLFSKFW